VLVVDKLMGDIAERENGTMMDKKPKLYAEKRSNGAIQIYKIKLCT
jgi:hypothetical protein